jgi:hypothetical protein
MMMHDVMPDDVRMFLYSVVGISWRLVYYSCFCFSLGVFIAVFSRDNDSGEWCGQQYIHGCLDRQVYIILISSCFKCGVIE